MNPKNLEKNGHFYQKGAYLASVQPNFKFKRLINLKIDKGQKYDANLRLESLYLLCYRGFFYFLQARQCMKLSKQKVMQSMTRSGIILKPARTCLSKSTHMLI